MARNSKVSRNAAEAARKSQIASKKAALKTLCKFLYEDEKQHEGKLPYGYMKTFIKENKKSWDWMTRDTMLAAYRRFKLKLEAQVAQMDSESSKPIAQVNVASSALSATLSDLTCDSVDDSRISSHDLKRSKGGRPVGTTINRKRLEKDVILEAKNEIIMKFKVATDAAREKKK